MATDDIERLHYYQRQYLGALDFEDQQAYHRDMRRRLNLAHHTWGIVAGLELIVAANGTDIYITPGMAIDGFGREIVMFTPTQLNPALFRSFHGADYHTVCLQYAETLTQSPQPGYGQCNQTNQLERISESFQVLIEDPSRDNIMVNGQPIVFPTKFFAGIHDPEDMPILPPPPSPTPEPDNQILPLDESVPYQELPVDDATIPTTASWLIRLGRVRWDGTTGNQQFAGTKMNPIIVADGRHYIGSVTSRLLTPARNLVVRDRSTNVPLSLPAVDPNNPDGVIMSIEGTLQVARRLTAKDTIEIDGGALDFRDAGGSSDGKNGTDPLFTITRQETPDGIDLRVQIGKDSNGNDHFVVSSGTNDLFKIADNGNTTVTGGVSLTGTLDFGSKARQMIDLWTTNDGKKQYGIGVQTNTTYFRSHNDFCWFQDGVHSDAQSDPGAGGQLQLKLDLNGDLYFGARTRQMLNLWNKNYGIGVQANALYYRSDSDFCWFKSGIHNDAQDNAGGGTLQMKLDASGGLDVYGTRIAFHSTTDFNSATNRGFTITLGQQTGVHGSDSIYGSPNLWLDADGAVIAKQGFRISPMNGAAFFPTGTTQPKQGDVVMLNNDGSVSPATAADDPHVVGVALAPTDPGFILAKQPYSSQPEGTLVALMGIVQCNVDNTVDINVGDLLTTSSNSGHAQTTNQATPRGAVFGKAMQHQPAGQAGTISVLLMPS